MVFLLAAGAWNRYHMTGELLEARSRPATMRRLIMTETLLVAIVLGLVAGWRFTPPPRASAAGETSSSAIRFHAHGRVMVEGEIAPGRVGPVAMTLSLLSGELRPLTATEVRVSMANRTPASSP